jgi:hypothetical protein
VKISLCFLRGSIATAVLLFVAYANAERQKMPDTYFKGIESKLEAAILADSRAGIVDALAAGADVNARGIHNITPLMMAVDRLKHNAVAELLERGAKPNLKADDGAGAVSLAVENYRDAPEIMFAVFKGGGDPNTRGPDNDPVIKRFMNDRNCEFIRHMRALGADLDITSRADDPIITSASTARDWDVVWCLIELGAKYDYEKTSRRPLSRSLAAKTPSPDSPIYPYKKKVWQFLKDHGVVVQPLEE